MADTPVGTIPSLTDREIQARVGPQSFQRGQGYFRDRAIFDTRLQGTSLKARCHGSSGGPYRLHVTFGPNGIVEAGCSCPVGSGGYCKHIAALLLTWRERPDEFVGVEDIETVLEQRSKEELIALVKQMLRQEPDLESLLEVPLPTSGRKSTPVDGAIYRRRAAAVFAGAEDAWDAPVDVAEGLEAITAIGDGFAQQHDYTSAAAVYEAVVRETLEHFDSYHDESGSMIDVVASCLSGLGECLVHEEDAAGRERILRTLFDAYVYDINFGGVGMSDGVPDLVFEHATPEERHRMAVWLRELIPEGDGFATSWRREAFGGFLLELEMDTLDDEAFLRICRETGRLHDLVDRLLALGRREEAVQSAQQASDYELLTLAGIFDRHDQGALADKLMAERSKTTQDTRIFEWLKDRARSRGDLEAAVTLAEKLFRMRPGLTAYRELRDLATQTGHWDALRPQLLSFLAEGRWNDLLVAIYLDDGEIDRALEGLKLLPSRVMAYGYSPYGNEPLALQVARAAAGSRPRAALDIYEQEVERLIAGRNRGTYAEAARLLVEMREIYATIGETQAWSRYIEDLRQRYRALRALKDEMAKAGL